MDDPTVVATPVTTSRGVQPCTCCNRETHTMLSGHMIMRRTNIAKFHHCTCYCLNSAITQHFLGQCSTQHTTHTPYSAVHSTLHTHLTVQYTTHYTHTLQCSTQHTTHTHLTVQYTTHYTHTLQCSTQHTTHTPYNRSAQDATVLVRLQWLEQGWVYYAPH